MKTAIYYIISLLIIVSSAFAQEGETVQVYGHVVEATDSLIKLDTKTGKVEITLTLATKIKKGTSDSKGEIKVDNYASITAMKEGDKLVAYEAFVYPGDDAHKHMKDPHAH